MWTQKLIYVRICKASTCPTEKVEAVLDKLEAQSVIEKIKFFDWKAPPIVRIYCQARWYYQNLWRLPS